jgi:hypothetical protein
MKFKKKIILSIECRKRRRKCVRTSSDDICDRCKRLERECIDSEEELNYTGYDKELPLLQQQVAQLSFLIDQMEKEAYNLSQLTNRNKSDNDDDSDKQLTAASVTNRISKNPNSKPWKLSFSDGMLHIETGIRSINDLMMQFSPIQYLSPLSLATKNEKDLTFQFSTGNVIRFMPLTIKLLVKCISRSFVSVPFLLPSIDNSPLLSTNINHVADELVRMYFLCRNTYRPMIHERSFMEHYQSLQSPLDSLVSLCICCYVSATPCNHTSHDSNKFRQLADFFYNLAKTKLMGQFDETEKRLENLVAINLLSDYMHITLQLDDFKNLVTLGHRICMDLEPWYKATEDQGVTVERALYCRHFSRICCSQSLLSLITNEPMHHLTTVYPEWLVMYDDSLAVVETIGRQNYLLGLYNHPYLSNIKVWLSFFIFLFEYLKSLLFQ